MRLLNTRQDRIPQFRSGEFGFALVHFVDKGRINVANWAKATYAHALSADGYGLRDDAFARIAFGFGIRHIVGRIRKGPLRMHQSRSSDQQGSVNAHVSVPISNQACSLSAACSAFPAEVHPQW